MNSQFHTYFKKKAGGFFVLGYISFVGFSGQLDANENSDYLKTDCIGSKSAKIRWVYLHGWDDPQLGTHERKNRKMLTELAKKNSWRIALPRGDSRCRQESRQCWGIGNPKDVKRSYERVLSGVNHCFAKKDDWGIVGFSNGGYFVSAIYQKCLNPNPSWSVMFGAAGYGSLNNFRKNNACGNLVVAIGEKDLVFKKAVAYHKKLSKIGAPAVLKVFQQGHVIPPNVLEEIVLQLSKKP